MKAAFVLNFMRFTEWPTTRLASRDAPLALCVWANDPRLSDVMKGMGGRSVDTHPVRVTEIERADSLARCHVLFVAESAPRGALPGWLQRAEALDVLTVGDGENFAAGGGMIGLVADGTRMRFEINDRAVKRSALRLNAQLYQLGHGVAESAAR